MSKTVRNTLVIAAVCLVVGLVLSTTAFALAGGFSDYRNLDKFSTVTYTDGSYVSQEEGFKTIRIEGVSENYLISRGESSKVEAVYSENNRMRFSFDEGGETFSMKEDHFAGRFFFGFDFDFSWWEHRQVTVKIPVDFKGELIVSTVSGNVEVLDLDLELDSNQSREQSQEQSQEQNLDSAQDPVHGLLPETFESPQSLQLLRVESTSGHIRGSAVSAESLSFTSVSGHLDSHLIRSDEDITLRTTSGNISATDIEARHFSFEAVSGNISAEVVGTENDYSIQTHTLSGRVTVPSGNQAASGSLYASTISGNIEVRFR